MKTIDETISIVGGGLAGTEAAYQLAQMGFKINLYEMRPKKMTPAHKTGDLAELVCSNSFGSVAQHAVTGQLKWEAEKLDSLILKSAYECKVPAGQALGIDRIKFAQRVTETINNHPRILRIDHEVQNLAEIPRPSLIATGPLTGDSLAQSILEHLNDEFLYFFDAIAPIIEAESIDMSKAWIGDRYGKGTGDYINCPMTKEEYYQFINEIKLAEKSEAKDFEKDTPFFEGCMPIEEMIRRGDETLRFGPLSPKGLRNPHIDERAYAVVQLRKENKESTSYNMVGFQTKLKYFEQKRIFQMIPGLEKAEFLKLGSIHRNMYLNPSQKLNSNLSSLNDPQLFFAGQITGVEGYFESTCIGLLSAYFIRAQVTQTLFAPPPRQTAFGALHHALIGEKKAHFQPTNINLGLFPPLEKRVGKREKRDLIVKRAKSEFEAWLIQENIKVSETHFIESMAHELKAMDSDLN
jgi:methylenetetrahydrofolate--tRNA-(uracil-5-)-methyltransferase